MKLSNKKEELKCEMQMTAMIDVVFQLLIFFMLSFKITVQEGDFNIKMPANAPSEAKPDDDKVPPVKVQLRQGGSIAMNGEGIASFAALRERIIQTFGAQGGPGTDLDSVEVELDCDYDLEYENVIRAVTAVSGYTDPQGRVVKLVEKIKFSPPKAGGGQ